MVRRHRCLPRMYEQPVHEYSRVLQRVRLSNNFFMYVEETYAGLVRRSIEQILAAEAGDYYDVVY